MSTTTKATKASTKAAKPSKAEAEAAATKAEGRNVLAAKPLGLTAGDLTPQAIAKAAASTKASVTKIRAQVVLAHMVEGHTVRESVDLIAADDLIDDMSRSAVQNHRKALSMSAKASEHGATVDPATFDGIVKAINAGVKELTIMRGLAKDDPAAAVATSTKRANTAKAKANRTRKSSAPVSSTSNADDIAKASEHLTLLVKANRAATDGDRAALRKHIALVADIANRFDVNTAEVLAEVEADLAAAEPVRIVK